MTTLISLDSPPNRYGMRQAMRSEITKLRTLRSTKITIAALIVGSLVITWLSTRSVHFHLSGVRPGGHAGVPNYDSTNQSLSGLAIGSLVIGVLGVLAVTAEYSSGTIRSSLSATPRRPLFLAAKMAVVGVLALVAGEIMAFACFFLGQVVLHGNAPTATLGTSGVPQAIVLSGAFLALLSLTGVALGLIIRHTAGAISAFVGVTFLLPVVLQPLQAQGNPGRYTPLDMLANSVATVVHQSHQLSPTTGFLWMVFYAAAALVVAGLVLAHRDA